jgi:hypothetical protein
VKALRMSPIVTLALSYPQPTHSYPTFIHTVIHSAAVSLFLRILC